MRAPRSPSPWSVSGSDRVRRGGCHAQLDLAHPGGDGHLGGPYQQVVRQLGGTGAAQRRDQPGFGETRQGCLGQDNNANRFHRQFYR
jgi:hypothetical protein